MKSLTIHQKVRFAILWIVLWIMGIGLAFWFGLGWYMLYRLIRRLLFVTPGLYVYMMQKIAGTAYAEEEGKRLLETSDNLWFKSKSSLALTLVNVIITIIFFWKINIPIIDIAELVMEYL